MLDIIKEFEKEKTVLKLQKEFLNVNIVGYRNAYLKEDNMGKLIEDLDVKNPDVVFIAQGSPRQEYFKVCNIMKIYNYKGSKQ